MQKRKKSGKFQLGLLPWPLLGRPSVPTNCPWIHGHTCSVLSTGVTNLPINQEVIAQRRLNLSSLCPCSSSACSKCTGGAKSDGRRFRDDSWPLVSDAMRGILKWYYPSILLSVPLRLISQRNGNGYEIG